MDGKDVNPLMTAHNRDKYYYQIQKNGSTISGPIATDTMICALGQATDQLSRGIEATAALADYRSKRGSECKIEITYVNGCAAMIVGHPGYAIALGRTASEAVHNGIDMCINGGDTNCHPFYSGCGLPKKIR